MNETFFFFSKKFKAHASVSNDSNISTFLFFFYKFFYYIIGDISIFFFFNIINLFNFYLFNAKNSVAYFTHPFSEHRPQYWKVNLGTQCFPYAVSKLVFDGNKSGERLFSYKWFADRRIRTFRDVGRPSIR